MKRYRIIQKILFLLYVAAVIYLCFGHFNNLCGVPRSMWGIPTDKIVHFAMFFPFPVLFWWAIGWPKHRWWMSFVIVSGIFGLGCLLAGSTEYFQGFTTYRSADILDFRADFISLSISSLLTLVIDIIHTILNR